MRILHIKRYKMTTKHWKKNPSRKSRLIKKGASKRRLTPRIKCKSGGTDTDIYKKVFGTVVVDVEDNGSHVTITCDAISKNNENEIIKKVLYVISKDDKNDKEYRHRVLYQVISQKTSADSRVRHQKKWIYTLYTDDRFVERVDLSNQTNLKLSINKTGKFVSILLQNTDDVFIFKKNVIVYCSLLEYGNHIEIIILENSPVLLNEMLNNPTGTIISKPSKPSHVLYSYSTNNKNEFHENILNRNTRPRPTVLYSYSTNNEMNGFHDHILNRENVRSTIPRSTAKYTNQARTFRPKPPKDPPPPTGLRSHSYPLRPTLPTLRYPSYPRATIHNTTRYGPHTASGDTHTYTASGDTHTYTASGDKRYVYFPPPTRGQNYIKQFVNKGVNTYVTRDLTLNEKISS